METELFLKTMCLCWRYNVSWSCAHSAKGDAVITSPSKSLTSAGKAGVPSKFYCPASRSLFEVTFEMPVGFSG